MRLFEHIEAFALKMLYFIKERKYILKIRFKRILWYEKIIIKDGLYKIIKGLNANLIVYSK